MSHCYKCGATYSGWGSTCPACSLKEQSMQQHKENLRAQNEIEARQSSFQREVEFARRREAAEQNALLGIQNLLAQAHASEMKDLEQQKINEIERQTNMLEEQAEKQTRLILEQSISSEEAYQQGFNFEEIVEIDSGIGTSETLHEHQLKFEFNEDGRIYIKEIEPDFITPKLRKSYIAGVNDRLEKDFSVNIPLNDLTSKVYSVGKKLFRVGSLKDNPYVSFALQHFLDLGDGIVISIYSQKFNFGIQYRTDLSSGKILFEIKTPDCFKSHILQESLLRGVESYVNYLNREKYSKRRIDIYNSYLARLEKDKQINAQHKANYENRCNEWDRNRIKNDDDYSKNMEEWNVKNSKLQRLEISLKLIAIVPLLVLSGMQQFALSFGYAFFYFISLWLKIPRGAQPIKVEIGAKPKKFPPRVPLKFTDPLWDEVDLFENQTQDEFSTLDLNQLHGFIASSSMSGLSKLIDFKLPPKDGKLFPLLIGLDDSEEPIHLKLREQSSCFIYGSDEKSTLEVINSVILSLVLSTQPDKAKLLIASSNLLELKDYDDIPNLLCPVLENMRQVSNSINWLHKEVDKRQKLMSKFGITRLEELNKKIEIFESRGERLYNPFSLTPDAPDELNVIPEVIFILDDVVDLMEISMSALDKLEYIVKCGKDVGVYLVAVCHACPPIFLIDEFKSKFSFEIKIESGEIAYRSADGRLFGVGKSVHIAANEIEQVVEWLRSSSDMRKVQNLFFQDNVKGTLSFEVDPPYGEEDPPYGEEDPLFDSAVAIVLENNRASISLVQRHLRIGYNRAARLLEDMEKAGLVSKMSGSGTREILN